MEAQERQAVGSGLASKLVAGLVIRFGSTPAGMTGSEGYLVSLG